MKFSLKPKPKPGATPPVLRFKPKGTQPPGYRKGRPGVTFDETANADELVTNPYFGLSHRIDPFQTEQVERSKLEEHQRKAKSATEAQDEIAAQTNGDEPIMNVGAARQWAPPWSPIHAALLSEPAFTTLSWSALQVLLFLLASRKRTNHTVLTVRLADMHQVYGWSLHSADSLRRALATLIRRKLIRRTTERRGSATATYSISWLERKEFQ